MPMSLLVLVFVKDTNPQKTLQTPPRPLLSRPWTEDQDFSPFAHRGCWHVTSACLFLRKIIGKTSKGIGETEDAVICNLRVFIFSSHLKAQALLISTGTHRRCKENRNYSKINFFPTVIKLYRLRKGMKKTKHPWFHIADFQYQPKQYENEKLRSYYHRIHRSGSSLCQVSAQRVKQGAPQSGLLFSDTMAGPSKHAGWDALGLPLPVLTGTNTDSSLSSSFPWTRKARKEKARMLVQDPPSCFYPGFLPTWRGGGVCLHMLL